MILGTLARREILKWLVRLQFLSKSPKILTTLASTIFSLSQIATNTSTLLPSSKGASEENEADYNIRIVTRNAEGI